MILQWFYSENSNTQLVKMKLLTKQSFCALLKRIQKKTKKTTGIGDYLSSKLLLCSWVGRLKILSQFILILFIFVNSLFPILQLAHFAGTQYEERMFAESQFHCLFILCIQGLSHFIDNRLSLLLSQLCTVHSPLKPVECGLAPENPNKCFGNSDKNTLLAPRGALIVTLGYYIHIQLFQIFIQSIEAIDVTSVPLSRLNSINAIDVTRC